MTFSFDLLTSKSNQFIFVPSYASTHKRFVRCRVHMATETQIDKKQNALGC